MKFNSSVLERAGDGFGIDAYDTVVFRKSGEFLHPFSVFHHLLCLLCGCLFQYSELTLWATCLGSDTLGSSRHDHYVLTYCMF